MAGKRVPIIGAGSGIGEAGVRLFLAAGHVVASGRDRHKLESWRSLCAAQHERSRRIARRHELGVGLVGAIDSSIYSASKSGVIGWIKSLVQRVAADCIRAAAICPGHIATTQMLDVMRCGSGNLDGRAFSRKLLEGISLGRLGLPGEVAKAVLWLASDRSTFVTGTAIPYAAIDSPLIRLICMLSYRIEAYYSTNFTLCDVCEIFVGEKFSGDDNGG
ncbi:Enoyl-(Acyl carrier protein) reductase [Sphingopyxis sp. YR583]|nr:Enoyl-(Acyl carrier protein) reductase [Sphingopyxis sp. YR583]